MPFTLMSVKMILMDVEDIYTDVLFLCHNLKCYENLDQHREARNFSGAVICCFYHAFILCIEFYLCKNLYYEVTNMQQVVEVKFGLYIYILCGC